MPVAISPGVYTTIVPLESYVQQVPSSTGFFAFFSDKGPDNRMMYVNDVNAFIKTYGEPNYNKYFPYGSGHLVAYNFIQNSPSSYVMRLLPDNATYANKTMFFVIDKPQMIKINTGSVTITVDDDGIINVLFTTPVSSSGDTTLNTAILNWNDISKLPGQSKLGKLMAMIKLGDITAYVDGTGIFSVVRAPGSNATGTIQLKDANGNITGSITISDKVSIEGKGSVTFSASDTTWGMIYLVDDNLIYTYDMPILPSDKLPDGTSIAVTSEDTLNKDFITFKFKNYVRPKYSINGFVLDYSSKIDNNTYSCVLRSRMAGEQVIDKKYAIVPDSYAKVLNQYVAATSMTLKFLLDNISNYDGKDVKAVAILDSASYDSNEDTTTLTFKDPTNSTVTKQFVVSGDKSSLQTGIEYILDLHISSSNLTLNNLTPVETPIWYLLQVQIDPNTNLPVISANRITSDLTLLSEKLYETVISNEQYALEYKETTETLVWKKLATWLPGHEDVYVYQYAEPLYTVISKYRGGYYNNYKLKFNEIVNKTNVFELTIYERTNTGVTKVAESLELSFNPDIKMDNGESLYIKDVISAYSDVVKIINWNYNEPDTNLLKELGIIYDITPVNSVDEIDRNGVYYIKNNAEVKVKDDIDYTELLGKVAIIGRTKPGVYSNVVRAFNVTSGLLMFDESERKRYYITNALNIADGSLENVAIFTNSGYKYSYILGLDLEAGSDGDLIKNGKLNKVVSDQLLVKAFSGLIDGSVTNTDLFWFDLVFDGGYSTVVKNAIVSLVQKRGDCVAILDNGDNLTPQKALESRRKLHSYNTEYATLYEPYVEVYDQFSGKYIWITPVYVMAELIATNDRVNDVWYAVAGFKRGNTTAVRNSRYLVSKDDRDNFYLNQLNPFVQFKEGTVMWGQLTTLKEANALQNLNVMRLVLYVKRAVEQYCRNFIFEFNDDITRESIKKGIIAFLEDVKTRRGLYDYQVNVYADEYAVLRKMVYVDVVLFPTRTIEKIMLTFRIK